MTRLVWVEWNGSDILHDRETNRNVAWVQQYPDLGYSIQLWDYTRKPQADWERIAYAPDLDAAKMIALLNVERTLV